MKRVEKFWEQVAFDIESIYKNGHPKEWKRDEVEIFIAKMHQRLKAMCQSKPSIAKTLKCWNKESSKSEIENLETLSYDTFRRIFRTKESPGSISNRNKFSIYLGYNSYTHYINEKNINDDPKIEEEEGSEEFTKESQEQNSEDEKRTEEPFSSKTASANNKRFVNIKVILILFGTLALLLSLYLGIGSNSKIEFWTAFLSALLYVLGMIIPNKDKNDKKISQRNFFSFLNSSKIRNNKGSVKQSNIFGFGNIQEVDNE